MRGGRGLGPIIWGILYDFPFCTTAVGTTLSRVGRVSVPPMYFLGGRKRKQHEKVTPEILRMRRRREEPGVLRLQGTPKDVHPVQEEEEEEIWMGKG